MSIYYDHRDPFKGLNKKQIMEQLYTPKNTKDMYFDAIEEVEKYEITSAIENDDHKGFTTFTFYVKEPIIESKYRCFGSAVGLDGISEENAIKVSAKDGCEKYFRGYIDHHQLGVSEAKITEEETPETYQEE